MAAPPRFYLDENIPVAVATQLQRRNIEVVTVHSLGLLGDSDINHLARATEMGYVLCTFDADYIELDSAGIKHAGIVFGQPEKHWTGEWVRGLELIHAVYSAHEMRNRIEYL
ncbi:MAG: DUF5615 family PIN-like protein [Chloroflexi bacterium]|nr:DUF5615 family PIN-like protein [Chloroflexota bacterium]